ncbi:sugar transferase [Rhodobacter ferrooxidans]|uniref:Undecaprenyl-phosphate galactose phosphotransferase n=1 Tax=Rhodobacter ferrooxidans TaxID=371731 RepID=C8RXI5_9RHOB|nr:sugar transferase [Rhodobacter sp. SW2]EEW26710.1 Undecaprenyl-phosphate galactose phosphotransferase [Rhodobacter sp. SW2]
MTIRYSEFVTGASVRLDREAVVAASPRRKGLYRNGFKRIFDVTAVVLAAPVIVPLVLGLALAVARDGGAPFYAQSRVGRGGRAFRMWKLRSMVSDADARMEGHLAANPEARLEWDETQKLKDDPRITPLGRFLRKASIDELPQLWNVLTGDMSLVGPRPMMLNQQEMYPGTAYYALRPGITGYWQTAGRNRTTFEARAGYDTAYEAELSLTTDLKVLARTIGVVVACTGF